MTTAARTVLDLDADDLRDLRALSMDTIRRMWNDNGYRPSLSSVFLDGFVHGGLWVYVSGPDRDYCGPLFSRAETLAYLKGFGIGRMPMELWD